MSGLLKTRGGQLWGRRYKWQDGPEACKNKSEFGTGATISYMVHNNSTALTITSNDNAVATERLDYHVGQTR